MLRYMKISNCNLLHKVKEKNDHLTRCRKGLLQNPTPLYDKSPQSLRRLKPSTGLPGILQCQQIGIITMSKWMVEKWERKRSIHVHVLWKEMERKKQKWWGAVLLMFSLPSGTKVKSLSGCCQGLCMGCWYYSSCSLYWHLWLMLIPRDVKMPRDWAATWGQVGFSES